MAWLPRRYATAITRGTDALASAVLWLCARLGTRARSAWLVIVFLAVFFVNGLIGLDFGNHWDEWYHPQVVAASVQKLSLMPEAFAYGGPYFTLGYPVIAVHQWRNLLGMARDLVTQSADVDPAAWPSVVRFKAATTALVGSPNYLIEVRGVFLGVTALAIVWAFLAALRCWPRRYGVALACAAFLAFSWELGYHARWVAIDAPLAQFAALELVFYCAAWRSSGYARTVAWYAAAAAAAAAVFGCKMTGGFAFLPIFLTPFVRRSGWSFPKRIATAGLGLVIFVLVSFALSPDFYLDPLHFLHTIRGGTAVYNLAGPSYPHYVTYWEHVWRTVVWILAAVPSPLRPVAFGLSGIVLVGLATLLRRHTRMTLCWLVFIVSFAAIFTHNHLMAVRQFLMFLPFFALCFAQGAAVTWDFLRMRDRRLAASFAVAVAIAMIANGVFESRQAWAVTHDTPASVADDAAKDLLSDRGPVRMSPQVHALLTSRLGAAYRCGAANVKDERVDHFLAYHTEHEWMANRLYGFRHTYGAGALNLGYYAAWFGRERTFRLVDVSMDVMRKLGRKMTTDLDCFPAGRSSGPIPPRAPGQPGGGRP